MDSSLITATVCVVCALAGIPVVALIIMLVSKLKEQAKIQQKQKEIESASKQKDLTEKQK